MKIITHWIRRQLLEPMICVLVAGSILLSILGIYLSGTLGGRLEHHVLTSQRFGPPENLRKNGFDALYQMHRDGGWDGQFYFWAASDILDRKNTSERFDVAAYRYQRIGLSVVASVVSRIFQGTEIVSGITLFWTHFIIILLATFTLAKFLLRSGLSFWLALLWSAFPSTIMCLLNGMPDSAGDAFFIMSAVAYLQRSIKLFAWTMSLAVLCRESFVLPSAVLMGLEFFSSLGVIRTFFDKLHLKKWRWISHPQGTFQQAAVMTMPLLVFAGWQLFLRKHFGLFPSQQAGAVIDYLPFNALIKNFLEAVRGEHHVMGPARSICEVFMLIIFTILLGLAGFSTFSTLTTSEAKAESTHQEAFRKRLTLAIAPVIVLYLFFGNTVMEHYTGYLKASGIFIFVILLSLSKQNFKSDNKNKKIGVMIFCIIASNLYLIYDRYRDRIPHHYKQIINYDDTTDFSSNKMECIHPLNVKVSLTGIEETNAMNWVREIYGFFIPRPKYQVFHIQFQNLTNVDFLPVLEQGMHPIFLSYRWLDPTTKNILIDDGLRSKFWNTIPAGETKPAEVLVQFPKKIPSKGLILRIEAVQEGCGWADEAPSSYPLDLLIQ